MVRVQVVVVGGRSESMVCKRVFVLVSPKKETLECERDGEGEGKAKKGKGCSCWRQGGGIGEGEQGQGTSWTVWYKLGAWE